MRCALYTVDETHEHTRNVNAYDLAEIHVEATSANVASGIGTFAGKTDFLQNTAIEGRFVEDWSLRKVLHHFTWHDRIHAKAVRRMAVKILGRSLQPIRSVCDWEQKSISESCHRPCRELNICNELMEISFHTQQYAKFHAVHMELARQVDPLAECQIGYFYYEGLALEKNIAKAVDWT